MIAKRTLLVEPEASVESQKQLHHYAKELIAEVCGILDRLYSDTIFKQKLLDFLVMLISLENVI
jgi:hypothetical protein